MTARDAAIMAIRKVLRKAQRAARQKELREHVTEMFGDDIKTLPTLADAE